MRQIDVDEAIRAAELEAEVAAAERERKIALAVEAGGWTQEQIDQASDADLLAAVASGKVQHLL